MKLLSILLLLVLFTSCNENYSPDAVVVDTKHTTIGGNVYRKLITNGDTLYWHRVNMAGPSVTFDVLLDEPYPTNTVLTLKPKYNE